MALIDINSLIGKRFNKLVILSAEHHIDECSIRRLFCTCQCDCGNIIELRYDNLIRNKSASCGCAKQINLSHLVGKKFGKLTVLSAVRIKKGKRNRIICKCECDCGNIKEVIYDALIADETKSCGCIRKIMSVRNNPEKAKLRLKKIWHAIKSRCY